MNEAGLANAVWTDVDSYVEAFERARSAGPVSDLTAFAPPPEHKLFGKVLHELIRVDLEFGWAEGRPTPLAQYQSDFPDLFTDPGIASEIAFEEYRLRRQAGDSPDLKQYRDVGIDVSDWQSLVTQEVAAPKTNRIPESLARAASAYWRSRATNGAPPEDQAAKSPHVALFRAVYLRDPAAADRLARAVQSWPEIGDLFCGFRLVEELGRGAFGRVYLARQGDLADRPVALKVVCDVRGEPQRLARLQHTNIVPVYSVHACAPFQALCMPFFGRTTLADVVREVGRNGKCPDSGAAFVEILRADESKSSPELADGFLASMANLPYAEAVLQIAERLAAGLAHAHERGVLHRDVKPANVLLADDGQPMLLDFNLASDQDAMGAEAVQVGGTLPYMAPEVLEALDREKHPAADARSDVYALGLVIWELLAGRHPFASRTGSVRAMIAPMRAERQHPPNIRTVNKSVAPAFAAILARCLAADPAHRYPSGRELHDDLQRQIENQPLQHAKEPSLLERLGKWRRRNPRAAIAALALAVIVPAVTLAIVHRDRAARAEAGRSFEDFRREKQLAWMLLSLPDVSPAERANGFAAAQAALARFDGPGGAPHLARLTESERADVGRGVAEMLLASAGASRGGAIAGVTEADRERLIARARELSAVTIHGRERAIDEAWRAGRFRTVVTLLREALASEPASPLLWFRLSDCYQQLGDSTAALGCLDACHALYPDFYRTHYKRGVILLELKKPSAALAEFKVVLDLQPDFWPARMQRAIARACGGDLAGAMADLDAAAESPSAPAQIEFIRARLLANAGDAAGAARARAAGFQRNPVDADDWVVRGLARLDDDPKAAVEDFSHALESDAQSRAALRNQAHAFAELLGKPNEALVVLDRLIAITPDSGSDLAGRGVVLARLGRRAEAHRDAVAALEADRRAFTRYQVAGIYALTSRTHPDDAAEATRLLASAFLDGSGIDLVERDSDLDAIRRRPEFLKVVSAAQTLRTAGSSKGQ